MPKTLIVYATRTGETENIGKLIAEGLRFSGVDVDIMKTGDIKNASELNGYDALVFGASLRLKSSSLGGGIQMAQNYGKDIANLLII